MVQHMQINKHNTAHKQNQGQKAHDPLNRCRKKPLTNWASLHYKSPEETKNRWMMPQHHKAYM
jgi:hypothetical protein